MELIGSYSSPFARFIRIILQEMEIDFSFTDTGFFAVATDEQQAIVKTNNPAMKVPILIDGDTTILDSRIIAKYLLEQNATSSDLAITSYDEENQLTTIYAILDSGVTRFLSIKEGRDPDTGYTQRSLDRIQSCLAGLNNDKNLGQTFNLPTALLICALEWIQKLDLCDWHEFSHLCKIHVQYKDRSSVVATRAV